MKKYLFIRSLGLCYFTFCNSIYSVLDEVGFILLRWCWTAPPKSTIRADTGFVEEVLVEAEVFVEEVLVHMQPWYFLLEMVWDLMWVFMSFLHLGLRFIQA